MGIAWGHHRDHRHQQPIHLPLTTLNLTTSLCGLWLSTPININLSIKVIHYVALEYPGEQLCGSASGKTRIPGIFVSFCSSLFLWELWQSHSTMVKYSIGWVIKSLIAQRLPLPAAKRVEVAVAKL